MTSNEPTTAEIREKFRKGNYSYLGVTGLAIIDTLLKRLEKTEKELAWIDRKAVQYGYSGLAFVIQNRGNRPMEENNEK